MPTNEALLWEGNQDPLSYYTQLKEVNLEKRKQIGNILGQVLPEITDTIPDTSSDNGENITFVVIGSDGKNERHAQSLTELVMITKQPHAELRELVTEKLELHAQDCALEFSSDGLIDHTVLKDDTPLSYVHGNPRAIYPDFLLNSSLVYGDHFTHISARQRILEEMTGNDEVSKRIRSYMRKQLSSYRRAIKNGVYSGKRHFDEAESVVFYDDSQYILGFKISFLRAVQRKLDLLTIDLFSQQDFPISMDVIQALPTRTLDRMTYLHEVRVLHPQDQTKIDQLKEAYAWFLMMHHRVQDLYKFSKDLVVMEFDAAQFQHHKEILLTSLLYD